MLHIYIYIYIYDISRLRVNNYDANYELQITFGIKQSISIGRMRHNGKYIAYICVLDVHESVHRDTIVKVTNKMQLYRLIYYF